MSNPKISFAKYTESQLSSLTLVEGRYYQCSDTGRLYLAQKTSGGTLYLLEIGSLIHDDLGEQTSLKTRQGENNSSLGTGSLLQASTSSSVIGNYSVIEGSYNSVIQSNTNRAGIIAAKDSSIFVSNGSSYGHVLAYDKLADFPTTGQTKDENGANYSYKDASTGNYYIWNGSTYDSFNSGQVKGWTDPLGQSVVMASDSCKIDGTNYSEGYHVGSNTAIIGTYNSEIKGTNSVIIGGHGNVIEHTNTVILGGVNITTDRDNAAYVNEIDFVGDTNKSGGVRRAVLQIGSNISSGNTQFFYFPSAGGVLLTTANVSESSSNGYINVNGNSIKVYSHPSQTSKTSGLYKITVDGTGHVSDATAVTKSDITGLGIPASDTNYYHTTGTWNGLTYTATANGGAGALALTIPTGTTSTTVALGNHTHSTYLTLSGGTMTGALTLSGAPTSDLHAATKKYVDDSITALPSPMIFKGTLGTNGTITKLPTASEDNEGFTYKVITAGTYASQAAKVGDVFISDGTQWVYVPSADEPSGTVTNVAMTVPTGLTISGSPITTSGTLALTYTSGYSIPTTAKQTNWDTAYGWGNHASAGYITSSGSITGNAATARAIQDYGDTSYSIEVGWKGSGIESPSHFAVYTDSSNGYVKAIKDCSLANATKAIVTNISVGNVGTLSNSITGNAATATSSTTSKDGVHYITATYDSTTYPTFSTSTAYAVGAYCVYNGVLYKCTTAHSASAWNSSHFSTSGVTFPWTATDSNMTDYYVGYTIALKFPATGSAAITLNINGKGEKTLMRNTGNLTTHLPSGSVCVLVYDGTYFRWSDYDSNTNTTYTALINGYCNTAAGTAAKVVTCTGYANLVAGSTIIVRFTTTNTVASALTINVNGQGAKTLYINGAVSSSSNYSLPAGTRTLRYDGTYWHVRNDGYDPIIPYNSYSCTKATQDASGNVIADTYQLKTTSVTHTASTAVGSATQPTYVNSNGVSTVCTYELNKTVPSDAVFTDHITSATTSGSGNAVTSISADANGALTITKGTTFLTSHQDISGKLNIANVDITSQSTTILSLVKALVGTSVATAIHYRRWFSQSDGGTSGISDKPTGTTNGGFVCEATLNRWCSTTDYRYVVKCWVQTEKSPYVAIVENATTAISWTKLPTTNTTYSAGTGISLSGTTFSNSGVRSIDTGTTNGTISVNTNGTSTDVAVKGLGSNAYTSTSYLPLAGGTMTGALNFANGTWNTVGDDVQIGDANQSGCLCIKGKNGATGLYFSPYSGSTAQKISINGSGTMTITGTVASTFSGNLTGNVTGNADTATQATQDGSGNVIADTYQLKTTAVTHTASTAVGSVTQPTYVDADGVATTCTYSLEKSVPSDAVFTDHITSATTSGSGNAVTSISADANGALTVTKGTTFSTSSHTHTTSIATSTGTNQITLSANTKYAITAGGTSYIFTTPTDTTYSNKTAASGGTDVSLCTTGEKYTWNNKQDKLAAKGSTTKPIYTSAAGTIAECTAYAGGTAVTLNNAPKAGNTASFYAPINGGTSGYVLKANGSTSAPTWVAQSTLSAGSCTGNSATATRIIKEFLTSGTSANTTTYYSPGTISASFSITMPDTSYAHIVEGFFTVGTAFSMPTTLTAGSTSIPITWQGDSVVDGYSYEFSVQLVSASKAVGYLNMLVE